ALVKAAIGQVVSSEELGGARMHAQISGTIDFREKDDPACLERLQRLVGMLPADPRGADATPLVRFDLPAAQPGDAIAKIVSGLPRQEYDVRDLLPCLLDAGPFDEYKAEFGPTLVCGCGRLGGVAIGIVANQRR